MDDNGTITATAFKRTTRSIGTFWHARIILASPQSDKDFCDREGIHRKWIRPRKHSLNRIGFTTRDDALAYATQWARDEAATHMPEPAVLID